MSNVMTRIPSMSDEDLQKVRKNAIDRRDDPRTAIEAEKVIAAIDAELEHRHLPGMIATFKEHYPGGFYGEKQAREERDYKLAARKLCLELLEKKEFAALLAERDWSQLHERAKRIVSSTNLMQGSFEKPKLLDPIGEPEVAAPFFSGLYDVLWGEDEFFVRFQRWCDTLEDLKLHKWTYATYFVFLADPKHGMFVKPTMLQKSLEISRYALIYESAPSAALYRKILEFSYWLKERISVLEPRDLVDVQSFMWHMAPTGKSSEDD